MASVQILPKVGENDRREWRVTDSGITDADVGKPVTLAAATVLAVTLATDGDVIYGWIDSVERGTDGGSTVVTVVEGGTVRVTCSGSVAKGALVESHTQTAAGTASVSYGLVSTHTPVAGEKNWMALVAGSDGDDIVVTKV